MTKRKVTAPRRAPLQMQVDQLRDLIKKQKLIIAEQNEKIRELQQLVNNEIPF